DAEADLSVSGTDVPAQGTVAEADASGAATDPAAQACAPGPHAAEWTMSLSANGQSLTVPIYVDPTSGADTTNGAYELQTCLPSSDVPQDQGGAPLGAKVTFVGLDITSVLTNPAAAAIPVWRAFFTSYVAGTATPDPTSV